MYNNLTFNSNGECFWGIPFWSVSVLKEVGYEIETLTDDCVVVEGVRKEGFWEAKHLDCPWYTVVMPM